MARYLYDVYIPPSASRREWWIPPSSGADRGFAIDVEEIYFDDIEFNKKIAPPTTADDFKVDRASKQTTYSTNQFLSHEDHFVGVDTSADSVTITLPLSSTVENGKQLVIKDEGDNASTYPITVKCDDADPATIDGYSSVKIDSSCGAICLYYNGSGWHIY